MFNVMTGLCCGTGEVISGFCCTDNTNYLVDFTDIWLFMGFFWGTIKKMEYHQSYPLTLRLLNEREIL